MKTQWKVQLTHKAAKQIAELSEEVLLVVQLLVEDLKSNGPAPGKQWPNYNRLHSKRNTDNRHCHLIKGHPTYVCCWRVNKTEKHIEVYYVGSHEKAPY